MLKKGSIATIEVLDNTSSIIKGVLDKASYFIDNFKGIKFK